MRNETLDSQLLFAQNAISNALSIEPIKSMLAPFKYDEARLNVGETLYDEAHQLHTSNRREYGDQFAATDSLEMARIEANGLYITHLEIARIALRGDAKAEESLRMRGRRLKTLSGWLMQAQSFYENALSDSEVLENLAKYGITAEILTEGRALITVVEKKYNDQLKETGGAQQSTQKRDRAFDQLQAWMTDFIGIARIALKSEPQYLEALGIVEPS